MTNPLNFVNAYAQATAPINNLVDVTPKSQPLNHMQVNDAEMSILISDIYQHLGIQPRQNAREDASAILQYLNQEQAYALAQHQFMNRQHAYMNGSVLERFRRWIGGHPMPPMHPQAQQQYMQYGQQPMYGQPMMYQQPPMQPQSQMPMQGIPTPAPMPMPEQQGNGDLAQQVQNLTNIVEQLTKKVMGDQQ